MIQFDERFLEGKDLFNNIKTLVQTANSVKIAVAYLTKDGFDEIASDLESFLKRKKGNMLEFIVGLSDYFITEPEALDALVKLCKSFPSQVKIGYYYNEGFHPKMLILELAKSMAVVAGSSNLTWHGMNTNVEANLLVARPLDSPLALSAKSFFEKLMRHADFDLENALARYRRHYNRRYKSSKASLRSSKSKMGLYTSLPTEYFVAPRTLGQIANKCTAFWKISPGKKGREWDRWIKPDGSGRIAIGWDDEAIGPLSDYGSREELRNFIDKNRGKWGKSWNERGEKGDKKDPSWYVAQQLWRFYKESKKGNVVVAYSDKTIFAVGKIVGDYRYVKDPDSFGHRKEVEWIVAPRLRVLDRTMIKKLGLRPTIFKVESKPVIHRMFDLVLHQRA